MNVINFPLARLEKRRELKKITSASFRKNKNQIFEMGLAYDSEFEGSDIGLVVNANDVSHEYFLKYLKKFSCFSEVKTHCVYEILDHFLMDQFSDSQDRAIEAILELTSSYTFGFSVVDAFEIWSNQDRDAYMVMLSDYSRVH
jgi:hypothetical protein